MIRATIFSVFLIGNACAADMSETMKDNMAFIAIRGELKIGDADKFNQMAQKYNKPIVSFQSPGGELLTGLKIGEAIRLKGFTTVVAPDSICASSCALAWLGGNVRFVSVSSRLGFHSAYRMDGTIAREAGLGNAVVGAYLTRIGLPIDAVIYITKATPSEITWLTPADGQKVGIEFSILEDDERKQAEVSTPASPLSQKQRPYPALSPVQASRTGAHSL
jgi:hypothetical protein